MTPIIPIPAVQTAPIARSAHLCPVCGPTFSTLLYAVRVPTGIHLYCPNARCWDRAATDGATGETEEKAYAALVAACEPPEPAA